MGEWPNVGGSAVHRRRDKSSVSRQISIGRVSAHSGAKKSSSIGGARVMPVSRNLKLLITLNEP